jgi:NTE family protein
MASGGISVVARRWVALAVVGMLVLPGVGQDGAQNKGQAGQTLGSAGKGDVGDKQAGQKSGGSKPAAGDGDELAVTAPAAAPPGPVGRRRIGLALGGGGALAMSEIGVLEWLEEHHIPGDMVAGTSMGGLVGALYATGKPVSELKTVMNSEVFNTVFRIETAYKNRDYRRREDSRELPNALTVGLKHRISFRNSVLTDQGLNSFLAKEFLNYDDRTDFNKLPIPFRCLSTDLNEARAVTFARGSISDAVRATVSIPGYYRPFELGGHEFVDGAILENLPTRTVRDMKADVVLAVSLPLAPVGKNDLDSILGVLERSFAVGIEANERASRRLADVVVMPDVKGFGGNDYLKTEQLAARGYAAAEAMKAKLLPYAVSDAEWAEYVAGRQGRVRGPAGTVLQVWVKAPNEEVTHLVEEMFAPLVGKPVSTDAVEARLADVRSDGRYDADYTIEYETGDTHRPVIQVTVADKTTGPPFLLAGGNLAASTGGGITRATVEGILLDQDLGGFGSELRTHIEAGSLTEVDSEYFRRLPDVAGVHLRTAMGGLFVAPHVGLLDEPMPIYQGEVMIAERQLERMGGGVDFGWSDGRTSELRAGWEEDSIGWHQRIGEDSLPSVSGSEQVGRVRYVFDTQDRALVPRYGQHVVAEAGYMYDAAGSVDAPRFMTQFTLAHEIGKEILVFSTDAGTMLNRNVGQPYRFTLGGPLHLSASATDQYRGTDYFLVQPALLRRVASLPAVLGQSIYVGAMYEAGQMRAPDARTVMRQDVFFGVVAETPLGVITLGPAIGDGGRYRLVFTVGKLF